MDAKALAVELREARLARIEAEAANSDLEELIRQVQHAPASGRCFAYFFDGLDPELAAN
ncbi:MAG: hypothetical protein ACJ8DV_11760 [Microvirga sp.]|jgi:hypothetical protein